jgi:hypothetical protein
MNHQEIDQRSLWLHGLVVGRLRADPSLLPRARAILAGWMKRAQQGAAPAAASPYHAAWLTALDGGVESAAGLALDTSEHGKAMRQTSPLLCLLDPREREALFRTWRTDVAPFSGGPDASR